jgi:hypothetical protein
VERWLPPVELARQEQALMKRLTRVRALFGFLPGHSSPSGRLDELSRVQLYPRALHELVYLVVTQDTSSVGEVKSSTFDSSS